VQNTAKQYYPGSIASYDTWPGNEMGLFYDATEPTRGNYAEEVIDQSSGLLWFNSILISHKINHFKLFM